MDVGVMSMHCGASRQTEPQRHAAMLCLTISRVLSIMEAVNFGLGQWKAGSVCFLLPDSPFKREDGSTDDKKHDRLWQM